MNLLRSLWRNRVFRALTWIIVTLLTLLVLFHQSVNWIGARRWKAAQDMLAREGETLDFPKTAPDPVPDARNFCAIPLLKDLALDKSPDGSAEANRAKLEAIALPSGNAKPPAGERPTLPSSASFGRTVDLKAWAQWLRKEGSLPVPPDSGNAARDVLAALSKHDALVAELVAELAREDAQWTPAWRTRELPGMIFEVPLPHYKAAQAVSQFLALRAIAAAQAGDATKAHESLLVLLRLGRASLADPILIGTLVGMTQDLLAAGVTWELCRLHSGTAEDFHRLELEWSRHDMRASLLCAFRGEMAGGASAVQWLKQTRDGRILGGESGIGTANASSTFGVQSIPAGWFDANAAAIVELNHRFIIEPLRDQGLAACVRRAPELEQLLKTQKARFYLHLDSILAQLILPATSKISARAGATQDIVDQAITACALERHRIAHGSYPDTLDAVKLSDGKPLPLDVFSSKALGYRKTTDGRYALWCVGFDGEDDGGKRVLDEKQPEKTKFHDPGYTGDWVWDFPQK